MDNMDSIEVRIPDEIRDYKEKFGGFTFRQWIGIVLVVVVCVPAYYYLHGLVGQMFAMTVTMVIVVPIGFIFFFPINGMPIEKMFPYFKRTYCEFGQVLSFQTENEMVVEKEMLKDKKYQKKLKKIKKLEKKQAKRLKRGDAAKESECLRQYRAETDEYYNSLRKEKIESIYSNKIQDVGRSFNKKERKKLKANSKSLRKERTEIQSTELAEYENDLETSLMDEHEKSCQVNSSKNSFEDMSSSTMSISEEDELLSSLHGTDGLSSVSGPDDSNCADMDFASDSIETVKEYDQNDSAFVDVVCDGNLGLDDAGNKMRQEDCSENSSNKNTQCVHKNETTTSSSQGVEGQGLSKRQRILRFYRTHPDSTMADCKAATGIEMRTIKRCWPKDDH